jgi:hypothetical protein
MTGEPYNRDDELDAARADWQGITRWPVDPPSPAYLRDWRLQRLGALRERESILTGFWFICGFGVLFGVIWVEGSDDWRGAPWGLLAAGVISVPFAVGLSLIERAQKRLRARLEAGEAQ